MLNVPSKERVSTYYMAVFLIAAWILYLHIFQVNISMEGSIEIVQRLSFILIYVKYIVYIISGCH